MSCLLHLFRTKKTKQPVIQTENPLYLYEIPETRIELEAFEATLIDLLISIHYQIVDLKDTIRDAIQRGASNRASDSIARLTLLKQKKQVYEKRLETVRGKLQAFRQKNQRNQ